jgi:mannose-6-phosphate isomerase-like protein (cupin superfamily)
VKAYALADLAGSAEASGRSYLEFIREESMSVGLYLLPADAVDRQRPHTEDEVYVVLSGTALFTAGDQTRPIQRGDTIFVAAGVAHRFHDITDALRLVVVFAPPEGSGAER